MEDQAEWLADALARLDLVEVEAWVEGELETAITCTSGKSVRSEGFNPRFPLTFFLLAVLLAVTHISLHYSYLVKHEVK